MPVDEKGASGGPGALETPFVFEDIMALDSEVAAQISAESRESFAQISRQRAAHTEEVATGYSQVGLNLQSLYGAISASVLTGITNMQANSQTALKSAGYWPTFMNPPEAPKPSQP